MDIMRRFLTLVLLYIIGYTTLLHANYPDWQNYTSGLIVNDVAVLGSDVWIATRGGITKLNKETGVMQFYTRANSGLPDNDVRVVTADSEGMLWFATMKNELVSFDGATWRIFTAQNSGLPSGGIRKLVAHKGVVWIGCWGGGVARFDGTEWTVYNSQDANLPGDYISALYIDRQEKVWVGIEGSGLSTFDGTDWTRFDDGRAIPSPTVASIAQEADGSFWFGTGNYMGIGGGVAHLKNGEWSVFTEENSDLPGNFVSSIYSDEMDHIWFATSQGLALFTDGTWTVHTSASSGLPSNSISIITGDESASVWIGTRGGGLARLTGSDWQTYNPSNSALPANSIVDMETDANGTLWIAAASAGLVRNQGNSWQTYSTANSGLPDNRIYDITLDRQNNLWCATYAGVVRFDNTNWTVYTSTNASLPAAITSCITTAKNGDVWVGTYGAGVLRFDGTTWHRYTMANGLPSNYITTIAVDSSNNIWIANFTDGEITGYGAVRFDGNTWKQYDDLLNSSIAEIAVDARGVVWIGTEGGIVTLDGEKREEFTMSNSGLPDNAIRAVSVTSDGAAWFGALSGISRFDGNTWTAYSTENSGLPGNFTSRVVLHNEQTWIGTSTGIGVLTLPATSVDDPGIQTPSARPTYHPIVTAQSPKLPLPASIQGFPLTLHIFDLFGREISELSISPGPTELREIPLPDVLTNGVYMYYLQAGTTATTGTFLYRQ
jgi:ligand-binding sensor domain-containing protein